MGPTCVVGEGVGNVGIGSVIPIQLQCGGIGIAQIGPYP